MFSQIMSSPAAEKWAALTALGTGLALLAKKLLARKQPAKPDYVTRVEFHQEMLATRDRIGAGYLAMTDRVTANHNELLAALGRQGETFERRLDQLETNLARLDERTR